MGLNFRGGAFILAVLALLTLWKTKNKLLTGTQRTDQICYMKANINRKRRNPKMLCGTVWMPILHQPVCMYLHENP
jgi:hypothetical protein